jgi:predicted nuclease with TOPRIM domain
MESMLTKSDIQKIKKGLATKKDLQEFSKKAFRTFATKEDLREFSIKAFQTFATKEEIRELRKEISSLKEMIQSLAIAIDKLVKAVENLRSEYFAIKSQLDRHEKWIHQIAEKLGIKLEY